MGIDNQDFAQKRALGYRDRKSQVYTDGRERLEGRDWTKRKKELAERSQGICERRISGEMLPFPTRCLNTADHAHHIVLRSVQRDDRLAALLHVCEWCHQVLDFEQREAKRRAKWSKAS